MGIKQNIPYIFVLLALSFLYEKFKIRQKHDDEAEHYKIVNTYLLNGVTLANSKKPIIWIHVNYEINSRWWPTFGSRNTKCINKSYYSLTIKSIIDKCSNDFNICLIDDNSFSKILPEWNVNLEKIANPIKKHMRLLGLANILYKFGGMLVPPSFICFDSLLNTYKDGLKHNKPFVGEFVNNSISADQYPLFPQPYLFGCIQGCKQMNNFIDILTVMNSTNFTQSDDFSGTIGSWLQSQLLNGNFNLICGSILGTKTKTNKPVTIELLLNNTFFELYNNAKGLYLPENELTNRTKYQWFINLSPEEVLKSETMIGKYLLASN